jgi:AcrR family transcriptional regulator
LTSFSQRGFRAATLREICARAGANPGAVNYHFHSKHDLYVAAVREACHRLRAERPLEMSAHAPDDLAEARARLRETVARIARGLLAAKPAESSLLLLRELRQPTDAFDIVMAEYLGPRFEALRRVLEPFVGRDGPRDLQLASLSVLGQVAYCRLASPAALRLLGAEAWSPDLVEEVVAHVTRFSERALGVEP